MSTPPPPGSAAALVLSAAARLALDTGELGFELVAAESVARRDAAVLFALEIAWREGDLDAVSTLATGYDTLLLGVPDVVDPLVLRSVGNAERRNRGAFSTPPQYARSLARRAIPDPPAAGCGFSVVDPACGAGALLRAALARLLELQVPPEVAAWALHGADADPIAVKVCRAVLAADLTRAGFPCTPGDLAQQVVEGDALMGATPACPAAADGALIWHQVFPAVLARTDSEPEPVTGWRGGFSAVVANPPWERLKVTSRDWAGMPPEGLRVDRAGHARGIRDAGRHPLTGTGELNAYLPFVETCWRLLAPGGRAAILVPAGIASDRSSAPLLETLAITGSLARLQLIEPTAPIFAGVSARVGVAIVELAGGPARGAARGPAHGPAHGPAQGPAQGSGPAAASDPEIRVVVGLSGPDDDPAPHEWTLPASQLRLLNPNTGATPLFGSATDAAIVTRSHRRTPVLVRRDPSSKQVVDDAWSLRLITPLHMTRDAVHFRPAPGPGLVPLWEAKNCALLDPMGGSARAHRYWVPEELMHERYGHLTERGWLAGYRNVSTTASPRTLLPTPLPVAGVGNSLPLMSAPQLPLLLAALSTLPVDYLLRQKHAGANVNFFKLEQVPVPPPSAYLAAAPDPAGSADGSEIVAPASTLGEWVLRRLARAIVWRPGLSGLRAELIAGGIAVPPDEVSTVARAADRQVAQAELDAVHAIMLGFSLEDLTHALSTFTALRTREERDLGRFDTAGRVIAAYRRLVRR